jgi:iron(III) transport system substrate-binding protein
MRIFHGLAVALAAVSLTALVGCPAQERSVVLYCAQDREFAEGILDTFNKESQITVTPKFDSEADKSVSLVEEIKRDKDRPRCDVFWNNEIVSTIRLQKMGLLQPYDSPSAKPFPAWAKAEDHSWHAFAGRARILIVNTELVAEKDRPASLFDLADPKWKGQTVMARPQFGTSATQAACLFDALGTKKAEEYYRSLKENKIQIAPGNKQVADWVADGKTPTGERVVFGVTDTDDAMEAIKDGKKVALIFPDRDRDKLGTLFIPNSVAILKNCRHPEEAKKLVDYLLSAEIEKKLAEGGGYQIPLNPEVKAKLPPQIETPAAVKSMKVDWAKAAEKWDEAQKFVTDQFAR